DDGQAKVLSLELPIAYAVAAQKVRAAHLEPLEIVPVVGDTHLVRLRVANAHGRGRRPAHRQISTRRRAAASGSPAAKTALPATRSSAPASTRARAFDRSTPPS